MALKFTVHCGYSINYSGTPRGCKVFLSFRRCESSGVSTSSSWYRAPRLKHQTSIVIGRDPSWEEVLESAPGEMAGVSVAEGFEIKVSLVQVSYRGDESEVGAKVLTIRKDRNNATSHKERLLLERFGAATGAALMVSWSFQQEEADDRELKRAEAERAEKARMRRMYEEAKEKTYSRASPTPNVREVAEDAEMISLRKGLEEAVSAQRWEEVEILSNKLKSRKNHLDEAERRRLGADDQARRLLDQKRKESIPADEELAKLSDTVLREIAQGLGVKLGDAGLFGRADDDGSKQIRAILAELRDAPPLPPPAEGAAPVSTLAPVDSEFPPGLYRVTAEKLYVTKSLRSKETEVEVCKDACVLIDEVQRLQREHRVRAHVVDQRVDKPIEGWISLKNTEEGIIWVTPDRDSWQPEKGAYQVTLWLAAKVAALVCQARLEKKEQYQMEPLREQPPGPKFVKGGLVRAARAIEFETGKIIEKGTIGEVVKVPGAPARVRVAGILFTAEEGEVEPITELPPDEKSEKALAALPKAVAKEAAERERLARVVPAKRFVERGRVRTLKRLEFESGKVVEAGVEGVAVTVPGIAATVQIGGLVFSAMGDGDVEPYEPPKAIIATEAVDMVKRNGLTASETARLKELLDDESVRAAFSDGTAASLLRSSILDSREAVPLRRESPSHSRARSKKRKKEKKRRQDEEDVEGGRFSPAPRAEATPVVQPVTSLPLPPDPPGTFFVVICPAGETGVDLCVRGLTPHDSVLTLKRRFEMISGVPPVQQCIVQHSPEGAARRLDDRFTLAAYGILPGERLALSTAQGKLSLTVRTANGRKVRVSADAGETVLELKRRVHAELNVPISRQVLELDGTELLERRTLAQSGVGSMAVVDLHDTRGSARGAAIKLVVIDDGAGPRGTTWPVSVVTSDTIDAVKHRISSRSGVPSAAYALTYNGARLGEGLRVRECGLRDGSRVRMEYVNRDHVEERAVVSELESKMNEMRRSVAFLTDRSDGLHRAVEQMAGRFQGTGRLLDDHTAALLASCQDLRRQAAGSSSLGSPPRIVSPQRRREELRIPPEFLSQVQNRSPGRPPPPSVVQSPPRITVSPPTARGEQRDTARQTPFEQRLALLKEIHLRERETIHHQARVDALRRSEIGDAGKD